MNERLDVVALGLAALACALDFAWPQSSVPFYLGLLALLLAVWQISRQPKRIFYLIGFAVLGLVLLLLEWPLPALLERTWLSVVALAIQARLFLIGLAERRERTNAEFARELRALPPEQVTLFIDTDMETLASTNSLQRDHIVRIQPGDVLCADGVISFGSGFTEELVITGDPEPAAKGLGKAVYAGSKNKSTSFLFRVEKAGAQTFLQRKARFLEKGFPEFPLLNVRYFLLEFVTLLAMGALHLAMENSARTSLAIWLGSLGAFFGAATWGLQRAFVSRSTAAGVLWKNLRAVEKSGEVRTLVTDPEGSVLEGSLRLSGVATENELGEDGALRLAAPLARRIENPASYSLLKEIRLRNIPLEQLDSYLPAPGGGAGTVGGDQLRLLDEATALREEIPMIQFAGFLSQEMNRPGASAYFLQKNEKIVAAFTFVDTVRTSSQQAIQRFQREGYDFVLVSSAAKPSLQALATEVGVEHFRAEAGPGAGPELMAKLKNDDLFPVWLDNGVAPLPPGNFLRFTTPFAKVEGEATAARWDVESYRQVLGLANAWKKHARFQFLAGIFLQVALVTIAARWPFFAVFGGIILAGPFLFLTVGQLSEHSLR